MYNFSLSFIESYCFLPKLIESMNHADKAVPPKSVPKRKTIGPKVPQTTTKPKAQQNTRKISKEKVTESANTDEQTILPKNETGCLEQNNGENGAKIARGDSKSFQKFNSKDSLDIKAKPNRKYSQSIYCLSKC